MYRNYPIVTRLYALCAAALLWTASVAWADVPADAVWIDVRTPTEYASGHLEGAVLIPYQGIEKGVAELKLERDAPIYLYCAVGGRAEAAKKRLQSVGYTQVTNVGGLSDARELARSASP